MKNRTGPKENFKYKISLTADQRERLTEASKNKSLCQLLRDRAKIVLLADSDNPKRLTQGQIASKVSVSVSTVSLTLKRFTSGGVEEVLRINRSQGQNNGNRKLDGHAEARLTELACSPPPKGRSRWTVRLLSEKCPEVLGFSVSPATVGRVLKNHKIRPHKKQYYCIPPSDEEPERRKAFCEAMEHVLDTYALPYDRLHPVICMDEKSLQLLGEVRKPLEMEAGRSFRVDAEYKRNGTAVLLVYVEPHTGRSYVSTRRTRTAGDWAETVAYLLENMYPEAEHVTVVCDNLNTHSIKSLYKRFGKAKADRLARRLRLVFTPVHGSWLNIAECQISIIAKQCLWRRISSLSELRYSMRNWVRSRNQLGRSTKWHFTTSDARTRLAHLYPPDYFDSYE